VVYAAELTEVEFGTELDVEVTLVDGPFDDVSHPQGE
jgi:hypothetical protein